MRWLFPCICLIVAMYLDNIGHYSNSNVAFILAIVSAVGCFWLDFRSSEQ